MIISSLELGLIFAIMSFGIFVTFKILDFPDLSVDGSFSLGAVTSALLVTNNHPFLALLVAMICGGLAGFTTGFLHTKMKIQYILAGIITMTGLYSINLRIGGNSANIPLYTNKTIFSEFNTIITKQFSFLSEYTNIILLSLLVLIIILILNFFFKTQNGLALRATGNNEEMVRASSINTDAMKILGLVLANSLVGLAAAIYTQHQAYYDISQGVGMMIVGLTSIIIGQSIFKTNRLLFSFLSIIVGSILYRILVSIALQLGMHPNDLKLMCAVLVALVISLPHIKLYFSKGRSRHVKN